MAGTFSSRLRRRLKRERNAWQLWMMLLPCLCVLIIFRYGSMYGAQIAFRSYKATRGIWGSDWVGLQHFIRFFNSDQCWLVIRNTLVISIYQMLVSFPISIALALLINNCPFRRLKGFTQTLSYAPHFISTVVMVGIILIFTASDTGLITRLYTLLTSREAPLFMGRADLFPHIYVWSGIWQHMGWDSIIYVAALSSVSMDLYEAAMIDGASKVQRVWYIDVPSILPTAITLLILNCGSILSVGFEKALLMQNNLNMSASQIISTYVYDVGLKGGQYSFASAVGLFNSCVNLILIVGVNSVSKKLNSSTLW